MEWHYVSDGQQLGPGGIAIFAALIYAILTTRVLTVKKINKEHAWMTGCCPEFLADFPEWLGPS